jgi:hypothetical protein
VTVIAVVIPQFVVIGKSNCGTSTSMAVTEVAALSQGLAAYAADEGEYPGMRLSSDAARNDFPAFFDALFGERKPKGNGGRNAPYIDFKEDRIAVEEECPLPPIYRKATLAEIRDPGVKKYLLDPWGNPYVYRAGTKPKIYSLGPNEEDDTVTLAEESDDLGNW